MENASKALLIAAAIIIAVVLISLGVMVLNNGAILVKENSDMSEVEITGFNNKFSQYFGTNVRGANVNALITAVNANNKANLGEESKIISITCSDTGSVISTKDGVVSGKAQTGKTYSVVCNEETGYTSGGLIHTITVTEKK